jgi:hypothetical protein
MSNDILGEIVASPYSICSTESEFVFSVFKKLRELGCTYDERRTGCRGYYGDYTNDGFIEPEHPDLSSESRFQKAVRACQRTGHGYIYMEFKLDEENIDGSDFSVACGEKAWSVNFGLGHKYYFCSDNPKYLEDFIDKLFIPLYYFVKGSIGYFITENIEGHVFLTDENVLSSKLLSHDLEKIIPLGFANIIRGERILKLKKAESLKPYLKMRQIDDDVYSYYLNAKGHLDSHEGWIIAHRNIQKLFRQESDETDE